MLARSRPLAVEERSPARRTRGGGNRPFRVPDAWRGGVPAFSARRLWTIYSLDHPSHITCIAPIAQLSCSAWYAACGGHLDLRSHEDTFELTLRHEEGLAELRLDQRLLDRSTLITYCGREWAFVAQFSFATTRRGDHRPLLRPVLTTDALFSSHDSQHA